MPKSADFLHLSPLFQIDDTPNRHQAFLDLIERRVLELEEKSVIKQIRKNGNFSGFIHPESAISIAPNLSPFQLNDDTVYLLFLEQLYEVSEPAFRLSPRNVLEGVLKTIEEYFGDNWLDGTDQERFLFFEERMSTKDPIELVEFKHKLIAECAEKASLAQNLLVFLGFDSSLVFSDNCQLDHSENKNHAYNLVVIGGSTSIFDPTNPQLVFDKKGNLLNVFPAVYQLSEHQKRGLLHGEKVEVFHQNFILADRRYIQKDLSYRLYAL